MSDFKLDAAWDMDFSARRAHLIYDTAYRGQRTAIALKHIMGEWYKKDGTGTDYQSKIWPKVSDLTRRAEFRRRCLQTPDVSEVREMRLTTDANRNLTGFIKLGQADGTELEVRFTGRD